MKNRMLKTLTLATLLLGTSLVADNSGIVLWGSGGYTYSNADQKNEVGSFELVNDPSQNGYNFELKLGYKFENNLQLNINYHRINMDDTLQNNTYLDLDYFFEEYSGFTPFLGGHLGVSYLEWSENPINTLDNDVYSSSIVGGARIGVLYPLSENFDLSLEDILSFTDHDTHLESNGAKATLTHNFTNSINIGLRYTFSLDTNSQSTQKVEPQKVVEEQEEVVVVEEVKEEIKVEPKVEPKEEVIVPVVIIDGDDDNDSVLNSKDTCPNTSSGTVVDEKGCSIDVDSDGVLNEKDLCSNTPLNTEVNSDGCPYTSPLNISFKRLSSDIEKIEKSKLQAYADFLIKNSNYSAKIIGYTDSRGSAKDNQKLSEKRAKSVVDTLISLGVNVNQLTSEGKGEANPIADNKIEDGRAKNRRIESQLTRK